MIHPLLDTSFIQQIVERACKGILFLISSGWFSPIIVSNQEIILKIFLSGGTKKSNQDCDEALIKNSWGSVWSIHILVSLCFG